MGILIESVRVFGFRGLKNIEVKLEPITVLTGMNNTGKTSFLKAMQIALGNKNFLSSDDFYINNNVPVDKIIVDIRIIAHTDGVQDEVLPEEWDIVFTEKRSVIDSSGRQIIPIRTIATYDPLNGDFSYKQFVLTEWSEYKNGDGVNWYDCDNGTSTSFNLNEITFIYTDAQRDLLEDLKVKHSFLGKMLSKIDYGADDVEIIEKLIRELNEKAVNSSDILSNIETTLKGLDSAMDNTTSGVEISPFAKKIRDLNKGVSIQYSDFSMEYHGMGTRSWSSLLTLKSFIEFLSRNAVTEGVPFFPILAIEEPEAHLHPNAQKKLFSQISTISGQKIISTHSAYIAASAELIQIRSFYKNEGESISGHIDTSEMSQEDIRKIHRQVLNTRGELFFSKAIILFEGETEEQSFPVFAENYFGTTITETGIDFVGVGGFGNYYPFIHLAESLNIPWFIFSDGETGVIKKIKKDVKKLFNLSEIAVNDINLANYDNIIVINDEYDFEKHLIEGGFIDETVIALEKLNGEGYLESEIASKDGTNSRRIKTAETCESCEQSIYTNLIRDYSGDEGYKRALYDIATSQKTRFGSVIADAIIETGKDFPPLIVQLFEKVKNALKL